MIYRVLYDGVDIHTNSVPDVLINPTVETEMNTAGSFSFTLPPDHFAWGDIYVLKGNVEVYENNDLIFFGRVANVDQNWNNERVVECEGALAFFNDSIQRPNSWTSNTLISQFLSDILDNHNAQVPDDRKIYLGNVTIDDMYVTRETNYEKTLDVLTRMCIDTNGGYFSLRKDENDGKIYIDWLKDLTDIAAQPVEFGLNLLDISRSLHAEDIVTGVLARGGEVNDVKIDLHEVGEIDDPSIPVIHHTNQDPDILWHRDGLEGYGRVVQVKEFNDCTTVDGDNGLLAKATEWLIKQNTDIDTIEVDAAELGYFGESYPIFLLGQKVVVNSHPHHLENVELPMYKISMNLDSGTKRISIGTPPKRELTQISASNMGGGSGSGSSGGGSGSGGVQDVRVNGTSVVQDSIARVEVPTDTVTESEMSTAISTAVSGKANQSDLESLATTVSGKANTSEVTAALALKADKTEIPEIEANPSDAATDTLNKIDIDGTVYQLAGGTEVEANPVEAATDDLETIKIGDTVYDISGGGSSTNYGKFKCELIFNTATQSTGWSDTVTVCTKDVLDEYDAIYVTDGMLTSGAIRQETKFVLVKDIESIGDNGYQYMFGTDPNGTSFFVFGLRVYNNNLIWYSDRNGGYLFKVYGLKFENKLINRSDIYSEEERMIGRWTDGKPLYQKTVEFNFTSNTNDWTVFDTSVSYDRFIQAIAATKGVNVTEDQIMSYQDSLASPRWCVKNDHKLYYYLENAPRKGAVTLQYTKTTDSADSGVIPEDPQMVMMSDYYSEDEQVVGSWTDGKPLYQKTWFNVANNTDLISNVDTLVDYDVKRHGNASSDTGYYDIGDGFQMTDSALIKIINGVATYTSWTSTTGYINKTADFITLKYTKTTDAPGTGPTKGNLIYLPALYSEEEREVGVWTDGKPLYQKNIPIPVIQSAQYGVLISNLGLNIDNCVDIKVRLYKDTTPDSDTVIATASFGDMYFYYRKFEDSIRMDAPFSWVVGRYGNLTIQYTKTTDQPGSGTWTPEGQLAHHYSTSEKVVGTWIDGSTIYERTINGGITFSANDTWYDTGLTGINKVVSFECSLLRDGEQVGSGFNAGHIDYVVRSNALKIKSYNLLIIDNFTLDHITIQYTKSS